MTTNAEERLVGSDDSMLYSRWVWASFWGWLLGSALVVGLGITWDLLGGGAQFMIGIGMGTGVGLMQGRVIKTVTGHMAPWLWATVVGIGTPFVVADVASAFGFGITYSLPLYVTIGAFLAGVLQGWLLRPHVGRALAWIPASIVGWTAPVGLIVLNDAGVVPGRVGAGLFLASLVFGGAILGAVTGGTLGWMRRSAQTPTA